MSYIPLLRSRKTVPEGDIVNGTRDGSMLGDYLENTTFQLRWDLFLKAFTAYLKANGLNQSITYEQKRIAFEVTKDYLGWQSGMRALPKDTFLQDYDRCEKLMAETEEKLEELRMFLITKLDNSRPTTASLARAIIEELAVLRNKLDDIFFDQRHRIGGKRRLLSNVSRKTLELEFTIDLLWFIAEEFPSYTAEERNILIGAMFAGAKPDLDFEDFEKLPELIPMRVLRAQAHYAECYSNPGVERVYSYLGAKQKVKKQNQEKKQK